MTMFEDSLTESSRRTRARNPRTVLVSAGLHALLVCLLLLTPLVYTTALPLPRLGEVWVTPPPPAPPAAAAPPAVSPPRPGPEIEIDREAMIVPREIPEGIAPIVDDVPPPQVGVFPGAARSGAFDGIPGGVPGGSGQISPPPPLPPPPLPPPPPPNRPADAPVRVTSGIVQGHLIERPPLEYPALARSARIQGRVVLEAVISQDGRIRPETIRVLEPGHTLLAQAAVEAVRQWRYRPYILNGEPVEVITNITVTYSLN